MFEENEKQFISSAHQLLSFPKKKNVILIKDEYDKDHGDSALSI